jgi:hypothetical protein
MRLKDIKGQIGVKFTDSFGMEYMTICLAAGMITNGDAVGSDYKTAVVVTKRVRPSQKHPGHAIFMFDEDEIELVTE